MMRSTPDEGVRISDHNGPEGQNNNDCLHYCEVYVGGSVRNVLVATGFNRKYMICILMMQLYLV